MRLGRSGSTGMEFALIALPLMILVFGGVELGRLMWTRNALQQTAVATARCMGVHQKPCVLGTVVDSAKSVAYATNHALGFSVTIPSTGVAVTPSGTCGGQSGFALVTLTLVFRTAVPALLPTLGTGSTLVTSACFPNQS